MQQPGAVEPSSLRAQCPCAHRELAREWGGPGIHSGDGWAGWAGWVGEGEGASGDGWERVG
jgi:hypothetical protein